jgi:hypothetical protein
VQMVLINYGTNLIVRGTHGEQCIGRVYHTNQAIVGMDNAGGVN